MKKPETMNPPGGPSDKANAEQLLRQEIIRVDFSLRHAITVFLDQGFQPSSITGGLIVAAYNVMKATGMNQMQISNELNRIIDGVREMAFLASENPSE